MFQKQEVKFKTKKMGKKNLINDHRADNYIIAHEVLHSFKKKKKDETLDLKLDNVKSFWQDGMGLPWNYPQIDGLPWKVY